MLFITIIFHRERSYYWDLIPRINQNSIYNNISNTKLNHIIPLIGIRTLYRQRFGLVLPFYSLFADNFVEVSTIDSVNNLLGFFDFVIAIRVKGSYLIEDVISYPQVCCHIFYCLRQTPLSIL